MKAYTRYTYGGPEVLQLEEIDKPGLKNDHILVRILANSVNPADWHILRGDPFFSRFTYGLLKPKDKVIGSDFAGIVEEAGSSVTLFKRGDLVFGSTLKGGAFAEYISVPANACGAMPDKAGFVEMAALPLSGVTAYQSLIKDGELKNGETILINGAAGGVGHLAVQIAKAFGARVTAVCSSRNSEFVRGLGADEVIEYNNENIHLHKGKYDLVLDVHGNLTYNDMKRMGKRAVKVGFTSMKNMLSVLMKGNFGSFPVKLAAVKVNTIDLESIATLAHQNKIKAHLDRIYSHTQVPEAIDHIEGMHARGKIGIDRSKN
jgi:NADPH:quinone reductase-like Zn-dependent oxidoreductase